MCDLKRFPTHVTSENAESDTLRAPPDRPSNILSGFISLVCLQNLVELQNYTKFYHLFRGASIN